MPSLCNGGDLKLDARVGGEMQAPAESEPPPPLPPPSTSTTDSTTDGITPTSTEETQIEWQDLTPKMLLEILANNLLK